MSSGACSCQGTVHEPRCLLASFQSPSPECGRIERVPVSDPALLRIAAAAERIASALEAKFAPPAPSVPPSPTVTVDPRLAELSQAWVANCCGDKACEEHRLAAAEYVLRGGKTHREAAQKVLGMDDHPDHTPSVPPSPTVPYVPRVGDVVRWDGWDKTEFLIQRIEPESPGYCHIHTVRVSGDKKGMEASFGAYGDATFTFVREATEEDKRVAAGLDATVPPSDAPKFKVGDRVRVKRLFLHPGGMDWPTRTKGYKVGDEFIVRWECDGAQVSRRDGEGRYLFADEVEPVAPPAPVAAPTPAATTSEVGTSDGLDVAALKMARTSIEEHARFLNEPAATTSEATDPRRVVGAVIAMHDSHPSCYRIVVSGGDTPSLMWLDNESKWSPYFDAASLVFVRWATREECERHGIPYVERGATTSEARPTHVRVKSHPTCSGFTKGKVYEVVEWFGGTPNVMDDTGMEHAMSCCEWEPATPPVSPAAKPTTPAADEGDDALTELRHAHDEDADHRHWTPRWCKAYDRIEQVVKNALSRARSGAGR